MTNRERAVVLYKNLDLPPTYREPNIHAIEAELDAATAEAEVRARRATLDELRSEHTEEDILAMITQWFAECQGDKKAELGEFWRRFVSLAMRAARLQAEERMREKCAKVADAFADGIEQADSFYADRVCELLAAAIRAIEVGEK